MGHIAPDLPADEGQTLKLVFIADALSALQSKACNTHPLQALAVLRRQVTILRSHEIQVSIHS